MAVSYDYYRIFYHVVQGGSFTQAARVLGNNQPNITRCINNLEYELGCKLFVRSKKGVTLTPEGSRLYNHIAIAYEQIALGEDEIRKNCSLESGTISISASEIALHILLLDKLSAFHSRYPGVKLRISNDSTPQAISNLSGGLSDYAVVTTPHQVSEPLHSTTLASFDNVLLCGRQYLSMTEKPRSLKELQSCPFICLGPNTSSYLSYQNLFYRHNLVFHVDMEAATMDQILPMIRYNLGIGFYPLPLAEPWLNSGAVFRIPLTEDIPPRYVTLIENTARPQSMAMMEFRRLLCSGPNT